MRRAVPADALHAAGPAHCVVASRSQCSSSLNPHLAAITTSNRCKHTLLAARDADRLQWLKCQKFNDGA
eukprot:2206604-Prymnesium_polylepis.1